MRSEVSDACRFLCFAPKALGRSGRVHIYLYMGAELLQLIFLAKLVYLRMNYTP